MSLRDQGGGQQHALGEAAVGVVAEGAAAGAAVAQSAAAEGAAAAGDDRVDRGVHSELQRVDAFAQGDDCAGHFVAGHDACGGVLFAAIDAQVGGANACGAHFEQGFAGGGVAVGDVADVDLAGAFED